MWNTVTYWYRPTTDPNVVGLNPGCVEIGCIYFHNALNRQLLYIEVKCVLVYLLLYMTCAHAQADPPIPQNVQDIR